jgi:hypothetical protein
MCHTNKHDIAETFKKKLRDTEGKLRDWPPKHAPDCLGVKMSQFRKRRGKMLSRLGDNGHHVVPKKLVESGEGSCLGLVAFHGRGGDPLHGGDGHVVVESDADPASLGDAIPEWAALAL